MDTQFKKQVVDALDIISQTANQAWWHGKSPHCGSDFKPDYCVDCFAFEQCKRNEKLINLFKQLIPAGG